MLMKLADGTRPSRARDARIPLHSFSSTPTAFAVLASQCIPCARIPLHSVCSVHSVRSARHPSHCAQATVPCCAAGTHVFVADTGHRPEATHAQRPHPSACTVRFQSAPLRLRRRALCATARMWAQAPPCPAVALRPPPLRLPPRAQPRRLGRIGRRAVPPAVGGAIPSPSHSLR